MGETDEAAQAEAERAVWVMVERQRRERPKYADLPMPESFEEACERVQFVAGGPETVVEVVRELYEQVPFSALHIQPRWVGFSPDQVQASIRRVQQQVVPAAFS